MHVKNAIVNSSKKCNRPSPSNSCGSDASERIFALCRDEIAVSLYISLFWHRSRVYCCHRTSRYFCFTEHAGILIHQDLPTIFIASWFASRILVHAILKIPVLYLILIHAIVAAFASSKLLYATRESWSWRQLPKGCFFQTQETGQERGFDFFLGRTGNRKI